MKHKLRLVPRRVANIDCDRPEITLWVRTRYDFAPVRFVVDTAADLSALPIPLAQREGIEFAQSEANRGTAAGLVGVADKYLGILRVRILGEEFEWPCDFLVPPATTGPNPSRPNPGRATPVLGRAGFLAAYSIRIDGEHLTIERRSSAGSWWRWLGSVLWPKRTREHSVTDPL